MDLYNGFSITSLTFQITNQLFNVLLNTELEKKRSIIFANIFPYPVRYIEISKFEVTENFIKNRCNGYVA